MSKLSTRNRSNQQQDHVFEFVKNKPGGAEVSPCLAPIRLPSLNFKILQRLWISLFRGRTEQKQKQLSATAVLHANGKTQERETLTQLQSKLFYNSLQEPRLLLLRVIAPPQMPASFLTVLERERAPIVDTVHVIVGPPYTKQSRPRERGATFRILYQNYWYNRCRLVSGQPVFGFSIHHFGTDLNNS